MKNIFGLSIALASVAMCGCVSRIGDATLLSTKNIDIKKSLHTVDSSKRIEGVDELEFYVIFPTKGNVTMKEAVDNAIESCPGAVGLSNATIYFANFYIFPIYGKQYFRVEGNPIYEAKPTVQK